MDDRDNMQRVVSTKNFDNSLGRAITKFKKIARKRPRKSPYKNGQNRISEF